VIGANRARACLCGGGKGTHSKTTHLGKGGEEKKKGDLGLRGYLDLDGE